jgi:hypothetical protein
MVAEFSRLDGGKKWLTPTPPTARRCWDPYDRCPELFEDFCVVTQSVRSGMNVEVAVEPTAGERAT